MTEKQVIQRAEGEIAVLTRKRKELEEKFTSETGMTKERYDRLIKLTLEITQKICNLQQSIGQLTRYGDPRDSQNTDS